MSSAGLVVQTFTHLYCIIELFAVLATLTPRTY